MPGSNEYSMDPEFISEGSSNSTKSTSGGVVPGVAATPISKPVAAAKPSPFYQQKDFRTEKLAARKGLMSNRRADRVVNRYMKSEAGQQAEADFARAESQKYMASVDAYLQAGKDRRAAIGKPAVTQTPAEPTLVSKSAVTAPVVQKTPKSTASQTQRVGGINWDQRAREYGFKDQADVAKWQATQPGLVVDGKFGDKSIARWQASQQQAQQQPQQGQTRTIDMPFSSLHGMEIPVVNPKTQPTVTQPEQTQPAAQQPSAPQTSGYTPRAFTLQDFNTHKHFRNPYHGHRTVTVEGKTYPIRVTTGLYGRGEIDNDQMYAFDEATGMIRKVDENMIGFPSGRGFAKGSQWIHPRFFYEEQWLQHNPAPAKKGPLGGGLTKEYEDWYQNKYHPASKVGFRKQGGTMNRINYFQQGGAAPQQDIKAQITALVQAAMQGDEKANQQVTQIMEAAKAGNQQAVQLAQMITEVAKQLQGQATAAKWGAKLNYIQSLKFAKGGKTCPACEKKVEMKACGGKKAKKHQEGGWLELLPIYGTYQAGKRFYKNPSWKTAGEFGLNFLGDAAMLSGIGLGAKAAVTGIRAASMAGKAGKATMQGLNTARQFAKAQRVWGRTSDAAARTFVKTGFPVARPAYTPFKTTDDIYRDVVRRGLREDRIADTYLDATRAAKAAAGAEAAGMVSKVGALE